MKIKLVALLSALASAAVLGMAAPTAASASSPSSTYAVANHSTIHLGSTVTISGWVTPNLHGHVVHLQRYYSGAWHTQRDQALSSTSRFSFTTKPSTAIKYYYRVYDPATASGYRSSVSATRTVTVQSYGTVILKTYVWSGDWQGPTVRIPTKDYTVHYSFSCTDNIANFLAVDWNPADDYSFEGLFAEPATADGTSGSGTWYGHGGGQYGYFDVSTQSGCNWTVQVSYRAWH